MIVEISGPDGCKSVEQSDILLVTVDCGTSYSNPASAKFAKHVAFSFLEGREVSRKVVPQPSDIAAMAVPHGGHEGGPVSPYVVLLFDQTDPSVNASDGGGYRFVHPQTQKDSLPSYARDSEIANLISLAIKVDPDIVHYDGRFHLLVMNLVERFRGTTVEDILSGCCELGMQEAGRVPHDLRSAYKGSRRERRYYMGV